MKWDQTPGSLLYTGLGGNLPHSPRLLSNDSRLKNKNYVQKKF